MADRGVRMFVLGIVVGGVAAVFLLGSAVTGWSWHAGTAASDRGPIVLPVQGSPFTPKEFVPLPPPNNGQDQGPGLPSPGASGQDCNKILYFFQGKLYQLRPGLMPRGGGNPEFYYMQPYGGPQIPGFPTPGPMTPGAPGPSTPDQSVPPRRI